MCCVGPFYLWTKSRLALLLHVPLIIYRHVSLNSSSRPLAVAKMECEVVDIGLDYILHSHRPPDPDAA